MNHSMTAFSPDGKVGLWRFTTANVAARITAQPAAKTPSNVGTDHSFARYPTISVSIG